MKFSKYISIIFFVFIFHFSFIYADQIDIIDNDSNNEIVEEDNTEIENQKKELKNESKELIEDIRKKINEIDDTIEKLRETEEYEVYPTIRLNIDTPLFGIKSIINQKLKITKDVSPTDVTKGYSIRTIVKNKSVKVPDVKVGKIVVSTKEFNIDDSLTISEYNTLILKLMNYLEKTNSIYDFLETQTNKIFKEYISKEKKDIINDVNTRVDEVDKKLIAQDTNLLKLYLLGSEEFSKISEEYTNLNNIKNSLSNEASNVLIESLELTNLQKSVLTLESDIIDYTNEISNLLDGKSITLDEIYYNLYNSCNNRLKKVEEYVDSSKESVDIDVEEDNEDNKALDNTSDEEDENSSEEEKSDNVEVKTIYEIYSQKNLENLKNIVEKIESNMDELEIKYQKENENSSEDKVDTTKDEKDENSDESEPKYETLSDDEKEEYFNDAIVIYKEFLKYEYNFYLDNINGMLKLTNSNITNLAEYTDADIIQEVKYIYLDLPEKLENYLDCYNVNSAIDLRALILNFKEELSNLNKTYLKVVDLYEKLNVNSKINND